MVRGRLADADVAEDGAAPVEVVERVVREGCAAYLGLVRSLAGDPEPAVSVGRLRPLEVGRSRTVLVAASAVEVYDDHFSVAVRLRPLGDGAVRDFVCRVGPAGGGRLPDEVRRELIEIEKAADRSA